MKRLQLVGILTSGSLAFVGCVEPDIAARDQSIEQLHTSIFLAPPKPGKAADPDATSQAHDNEAKKNPPGQLKPKPRNKKGQVAGEPPPPPAAAVGGNSRIYTLDGDFDEGAYSNVVHDPSDQLQLDDTTTPFNFMWVAVSSKGTIVKIDTETGAVLGEYRSAPAGQPTDPSRTTVDKSGNVWAGNRAGASVVHIGLVENHQCVDRNLNGQIDTSTGLGDVLDWTNAGSADTNGGVATAADECIIHYTKVNSSGTRHVSVTSDNDVWVSGLGGRKFDLIDGATGAITRSEGTVNAGGYGGLIDGAGVIWSARPLMRWDTSKPLTAPNVKTYSHDSYGLCIDSKGQVWNTSLDGNKIHKFAPDGTLLGSYAHGAQYAQGCVVDRNDHVWVAHSILGNQNTIGHLLPDGSLVGNVTVGSGPTGVAVDARGKIWTTNYASRTVSRIDPTAGPMGGPGSSTPVGAVDFTTVDLGGLLYNYSDMTGSTLHGAPANGTWEVLHDSGASATNWGKVTWNAKVVGDGFVKVTVASSEDGVNFGPSQDASSGVDLTVADGRYLQVSVAFQRSGTGVSPILYDLAVAVGNEAPNCSKAAPSQASLWPPNHKFEQISILGVTDPEGGGTGIRITGIRQDEHVDDKADGNTTPDGQGVGTTTAEVRAERSGKGDGRVYHISFTATDPGGLSCNGTVQVGVPHDKKDTPVDGGPDYDSTVP
jgi:streptogramin lyase